MEVPSLSEIEKIAIPEVAREHNVVLFFGNNSKRIILWKFVPQGQNVTGKY